MSNKLTLDVNKLYTKLQYSKDFKINRMTLDAKIKKEEIKSIKINGGLTIVIAN